MSGYAVFVEKDRVHVATDSAGVDKGGNLAMLDAKVIVFPHINGVLSYRGLPLQAAVAMSHVKEMATSFDAVIERAPEKLKSVFSGENPALKASYDATGYSGEIDLVWAGISETRGPTMLTLSARKHEGQMQWITDLQCDEAVGGSFATKVFPAWFEHLQKRGIPAARAFFELPRLMQLMREYPDANGRSVVGGPVMLTTVTRNFIVTRRLMSWPDELGKPIDACAPATIDQTVLHKARAAG